MERHKIMKSLITTYLINLFLPILLYSAEYMGKNIDGVEYDCTAYSYSTNIYYDVSVEFDGDEATITFRNKRSITVTLDDEIIDDPSSINTHDDNRGVYWELEVNDLE